MLTKKLKLALVALAFAALALFGGSYVTNSLVVTSAIVVVADGGANAGPPGSG